MTSFVPYVKYVLRLAIQDPNLHNLYKTHIDNHNNGILNSQFPNSGFDLFIPNNVLFQGVPHTYMVGLGIKCEMIKQAQTYAENSRDNMSYSSPFYMYPRSSISKTPLMLSNHVGIIDSGYRGELIAAFRNLSDLEFSVDANTRLVQICTPNLEPFLVEIVDESELSTTERGSGGFGSTGIVG